MKGRAGVKVVLPTAADTRTFGARLAALLEPGDLLVLAGPLGAGKTVVVQGIGAGLGVTGAVTSPTFVLAREHAGRLPLVHVDAYRLGGTLEVDDLDLDSDLATSVTAVEWGGGLVEGLADDHLRIEVERPVDGDVRTVLLLPSDDRWARRLEALDRVPAVEAVLFDLDGVLADSTVAVERHWSAFAVRHGLDPAALLPTIHGRRSIDTIAAISAERVAAGGAALDVRAENARLELDEATDNAGVVVVPGAAALLAALPADRWAVVTSGTRPVATARLRAAGLPEPAVLITAERVCAGKPDPEGYLAAATALGRDPARCLVVEDAPAGVAAGRAAGARVLALSTSHPAAELDTDLHAPDLTAVTLTAVTPDALVLLVR